MLIFYLYQKPWCSLRQYLRFTPFFIGLYGLCFAYLPEAREVRAGLPAFWLIGGIVLVEKEKTQWVQFVQRHWVGKLLFRLGGSSYLLYLGNSLAMGITNSLLKKVQLFDILPHGLILFTQILFIHWAMLLLHERVERPFLAWQQKRFSYSTV